MSFWEFTTMARRNPITTDAFLTAYNARDFSNEQILAREIIQNSTDAGRKTQGLTEIEFHSLTFSEENKGMLVDLLQMNQSLRPRIAAMSVREDEKKSANAIQALIDAPVVSALLIRDFNTCGLGGKWDAFSKADHFGRLVMSSHLNDKSDGEEVGGSYGRGKTVYAHASSIHTVLYHSTFKKTDETDGQSRRLMGSGVYPRHEIEGKDYTGFGYFGIEQESPEGGVEARPFINDEAATLWERISNLADEKTDLGRSEKKYGTDVLILGVDLDLLDIQAAAEDFWFPAILSGDVAVRFYHSDGRVTRPNPKGRNNLDQFIRLWEQATIGKDLHEKERRISSFRRFRGMDLGVLAVEKAEVDEAASEKANCVAIMRPATKMVLSYIKYGSELYVPAVGFFIASRDTFVGRCLQSSEDEAHSEWSHQSLRLRRAHGDDGVKLVKTITTRLNDQFRVFQKSLQPEAPKTLTSSGLLSRLLTKVFSGGGSGYKQVVGDKDAPFATSFTIVRRTTDKSQWRLRLTENERSPVDPIDVGIQLSVQIAGDRMISVKRKFFHVTDNAGNMLDFENLKFPFSQGNPIELLVEFDSPGSYNYNLTAKATVIEKGGANIEGVDTNVQ